MTLSTSSADIWRGVSWLVMDAGGMSVSGWGAGCLSLRAERVSSSRSLMMSSKEARRTAPLKSPSSSLEDIQAARDSQDWWDGLCGRLLEGCWSGSPSSLITWVARVAKVLRCPPRFGVRRQRTEKRKRRSQQMVEFSLTTSSIIARSRAARGILFRIWWWRWVWLDCGVRDRVRRARSLQRRITRAWATIGDWAVCADHPQSGDGHLPLAH